MRDYVRDDVRDYVRDDVRDESFETPLYKGFLLKNVRDERLCSFVILLKHLLQNVFHLLSDRDRFQHL